MGSIWTLWVVNTTTITLRQGTLGGLGLREGLCAKNSMPRVGVRTKAVVVFGARGIGSEILKPLSEKLFGFGTKKPLQFRERISGLSSSTFTAVSYTKGRLWQLGLLTKLSFPISCLNVRCRASQPRQRLL